MNQATKYILENLSYEELLKKMRNAPHSFFSPSASKDWLNSNLSVESLLIKFCNDILPINYQRQQMASHVKLACDIGTTAHAYIVLELAKRLNFDKEKIVDFELDYNIARGEADLCKMHTHYAHQAINYVMSLIDEGDIVKLEERVYFYEDICFGACDISIAKKNGTLIILDYKSGYWYVEPENNSQLLIYTLATKRTCYKDMQFNKINYAIMQPRINQNFTLFEVEKDNINHFYKKLNREVSRYMRELKALYNVA